MSTDGSSQHSHKNNFLLRISANVDGYSMCNEEEVEVIREMLSEANSLLNDGNVIPDTFLRDATFGQKSKQESQNNRCAVDTDSNNKLSSIRRDNWHSNTR